jgi:hypothetical protein
MALTDKQIADLNGAMEANRLASVGTLLDAVTTASATNAASILAMANFVSASAAGLKVAHGTAVPTAGSYTVTASSTGLTSVLHATATIAGSPIATHTSTTVFKSSGSLILKNWVNSGSVVTAASSTFADVDWIAVGV